MAGHLLSADFMEEQLVPGLVHSVSLSFSDSCNSSKVSRRIHHDTHSRKQRARAFDALFIIVSLLVAMLVLLKCLFVNLKQVEAKASVRLLASGEDEGEKDMLQSIMEICGIIPELEAPREGEKAAPPALPPEPSAGPSEAALEIEEPRKKRRKTKWLERQEKKPSPEPLKKVHFPQPPLLKEPAVILPEDELAAAPSYAVLQGAPFLSVSESPTFVLQAPALPAPPPAGQDVQPGPQHVWAHPPSEPESAAILQKPHLYVPLQQIAGTAEVSTTGEGTAAQTAVAGGWPAGAQLPAGFSPLLVGPGKPGAPAGQPLTAVLAVAEGAELLTMRPQPVSLASQYAQVISSAEQEGGKSAEDEGPGEEAVLLPATAIARRSVPPGPRGLELHPFYRLPLGHTGGVLPVFDPAAALAARAGRTRLSRVLRLLRPLLAKDVLSHEEAETLLSCAYSLVAYSSKWNISDFQGLSLSHALGPLVYRLLTADALLCICHILGPSVMKPDKWWNPFMERLAAPLSITTVPVKTPSFYLRDLVEKFLSALGMYKEQQRPLPSLLVELKRKIFRAPCVRSEFNRHSWDAWRRDDEEFQ